MTRDESFNFGFAGIVGSLFCLAILFIIFSNPVNNEAAVLVLFGTLGVSGLLLFHSTLRAGVSIPSIFFFLYFTWFYIVPGIFQAAANRYYWTGLDYAEGTALTTAVMILLFLLSFAIGQFMTPQALRSDYIGKIARNEAMPRTTLICLFSAVTVLLAWIVIYHFGIDFFLVSRGKLSAARAEFANPIAATLFTLPRVVLVICIALLFGLRRRGFGPPVVVNTLLIGAIGALLIIAFPGSLGRTLLFGIVIALLLIFFPFRHPKTRLAAVLIISFGIFTVFPISQQINRGTSFKAQIELPSASEYMLSGDFDGFQTTMNAVVYTEQHGHTMGHQIGSAMLVFIPRSLWPGKAEATGVLTSKSFGYVFTNLSTPIVGELYIDWGVFGVIIGGLLIGLVIRRLDLMYTAAIEYGGITIHRVGIAIFSSLIIILLRGSLMGVISLFMAAFAAIYFIHIWPHLTRLFIAEPEQRRAYR